jgi:hypothetical protein
MNFMKLKDLYCLFFILSILFIACGPSTKIEKTWTDPSFTSGSQTFHKVLVMGLLKDESTRGLLKTKWLPP